MTLLMGYPYRWGQTSNRTSFYKVPLIVVASVILAVGISIGIILCPSPLPLLTQLTRRSIVFSRRKANRKQKRRAERLRQKALAAAGLSEDNVKGSAAETAFKEKLAGLEQQHVARRGKEDRSSFVKVKVRKWHRGLRRRKGKPKDEEPEIEVIEEDESAATVNEVITPTLRRRSTESMILAGTRGSPRLMDELPLSPTGEVVVNREEAIGEGPHLARSTTYFPPAYRPASVRSYRISDPHAGTGPSRSAGTSAIAAPALDALPTAEEKTRASGYYPAPATHDIEVALAVASRSDGKGRASVPNIDEEDEERARMRHIATDDKRILEQLRLGASAPLMSPVGEYSTADGPSAPDVEVDEQGFERPTEDIFDLPELFRPPPQSFDVESMGDILPAPPRMVPHRSFRMSVDIDSSAEPEPFDELHLVPSAPPITGIADAPSAPPMMDDDDAPAPSAPPLALEKKDEDSNPEGMSSCDHISRSRSPVQGNSAEVSSPNSAVTGGGAFSALAQTTLGQPVFSPRYAP